MIGRITAGIIALILVTATACSSSSPTRSSSARSSSIRSASIQVQPSDGLLDSSVAVSVSGLAPASPVTITASAQDQAGTTWRSSAQFVASSGGTISLDDASTGGSYTGSDPMGLFDLMAPPDDKAATTPSFISPLAGYVVTVATTVAGRTVATAMVHRDSGAGMIKSRRLLPAVDGVYGELDTPLHSTGRKPAVLLFGGSGGGLGNSAFSADRLAARGYPALGLAYFKEPGLPTSLNLIPLEYFVKALQILRSQPDVDPNHVFVSGDSRGSEAALLLGADFPDLVDGVIAGVPSSVVNVGYPDPSTAAWTLHGQPLPTVPVGQFGNPTPPDTAAIIPVERIRGPIVTVCAGQDQVWPSCPYAAAIKARLQAHHVAYPLIALSYPAAGHLAGILTCCYSATAASMESEGGTLVANQSARRDTWSRVLALLATQ